MYLYSWRGSKTDCAKATEAAIWHPPLHTGQQLPSPTLAESWRSLWKSYHSTLWPGGAQASWGRGRRINRTSRECSLIGHRHTYTAAPSPCLASRTLPAKPSPSGQEVERSNGDLTSREKRSTYSGNRVTSTKQPSRMPLDGKPTVGKTHPQRRCFI